MTEGHVPLLTLPTFLEKRYNGYSDTLIDFYRKRERIETLASLYSVKVNGGLAREVYDYILSIVNFLIFMRKKNKLKESNIL